MKNRLNVFRIFGLCLLLGLVSWSFPAPGKISKSTCISFVSTAISPNGDGINDQFRVKCACEFVDYSMEIFNNQDEMVYSSYDINETWDGFLKGNPAPVGKYNWVMEYRLENGVEKQEEGNLILIR